MLTVLYREEVRGYTYNVNDVIVAVVLEVTVCIISKLIPIYAVF